MDKESFNPYLTQEKRRQFVKKAAKQGVFENLDVSRRAIQIGVLASMTGAPFCEIGEMFPDSTTRKPLSKQLVNQDFRKFLRATHKSVSTHLRNTISIKELLRRIPQLPENGPTMRVKTAVEKDGITDARQLQEIAGSRDLARARTKLKRIGIKIPYVQPHVEFEKRAETETNDRELQKMLDGFSDKYLRYYLTRRNKGERKTLITLSRIVVDAGIHIKSDRFNLILESLIRNEKQNHEHIPLRKVSVEINDKIKGRVVQNYHAVYIKHWDRILEVLINDPKLQKFRKIPWLTKVK